MPTDVGPRPGQSKFKLHVELVQLAGDYRLVERLPGNRFRVSDDVARRFADRGGGGPPGGGGSRPDDR